MKKVVLLSVGLISSTLLLGSSSGDSNKVTALINKLNDRAPKGADLAFVGQIENNSTKAKYIAVYEGKYYDARSPKLTPDMLRFVASYCESDDKIQWHDMHPNHDAIDYYDETVIKYDDRRKKLFIQKASFYKYPRAIIVPGFCMDYDIRKLGKFDVKPIELKVIFSLK